MTLEGQLRHVNCPNWGVTATSFDFPRFIMSVCERCLVDIRDRDAVPTYPSDDGVFYSIEINGHYVEIAKES